jgi:nitroimidazol reductase NimA-like FMN-containing flavoprotein (pyridoxamine 5'-phosphate oxidase superfamily)
MSTQSVETKVEKVDINLDDLFDGAASATSVTVPETSETRKVNIFAKEKPADFSFADPSVDNEDESDDTSVENQTAEAKTSVAESADILDSFANEDQEVEEKTETRGRKKIEGIGDVFSKLIKEDKIVPFDDEKPFDEYTAKDWEELIEANLEERANQVRRETPKQFFDSLPQELQIAARYVANGGQDLKSLFSTLAQAEQVRDLDVTNERDQELIIRDYLSVTGYGTAEEIEEEIELWKDLGKLEQQAHKFKPKLDKMQEQVVARKLEEQEMRRKQQEQASHQYMQNVYETLKEGTLGDVKIDRKTQNMLYNGLVQPNYPSVSGRNTNLLGHLLEKYQFVEPNYTLISEALWLLSDPEGYKSKIMEKGSQAAVESTVRKLKTEQANSGGSSLGVDKTEEADRQVSSKRKIQRPNNIFKRF